MPYQFTVSPDFTPSHLAGWFIFNTWLQRQMSEAIHLEIYHDFQAQRQAIENDQVDLIYANPFDAAMLVREKGFRPLVRATGVSGEAIIAVNHESKVDNVVQFDSAVKVAVTDAPDIQMMGMIMLEPGDLDADNVENINCQNYVLVAKKLFNNEADAGIFLESAYDELSSIVKARLRIIVRSQISVIHHTLMVGPRLFDKSEQLHELLINMQNNEKAKGVLDSLGFQQWETVDDEEMYFMNDLVDTLLV
ncbi:MAG: PhnD/SsuA/transferrin family substrate-binding protein [Methyloprofundus sp.]|nr:PhnD/SsuA/transferrin family substrate-binding protein [Methyloprofundus sp.]